MLSEKVRFLMDEQNITAYKLSKITGISQVSLLDIAAGRTVDPKASTVKSLADALGTTTDYLLDDTPPAQNKPPAKRKAS